MPAHSLPFAGAVCELPSVAAASDDIWRAEPDVDRTARFHAHLYRLPAVRASRPLVVHQSPQSKCSSCPDSRAVPSGDTPTEGMISVARLCPAQIATAYESPEEGRVDGEVMQGAEASSKGWGTPHVRHKATQRATHIAPQTGAKMRHSTRPPGFATRRSTCTQPPKRSAVVPLNASEHNRVRFFLNGRWGARTLDLTGVIRAL